jgi:hypothetical protein
MIETIKWFENTFFGSEIINGPITLTFVTTLILMVLTLIGMCLSVLSLMIYFSKYILQQNPIREELVPEKSQKKMVVSKFLIAILAYTTLWVITFSLIGLLAIFITPVILIAGYFLFKMLAAFLIHRKSYNFEDFKATIKDQLELRNILYAIMSSGIFLGFYFLIAFTIPWAVFYPNDITAFLISFTVFPFYLSTEIFYRKVLFPLSRFMKSRKMRTLTLSIIILIIHLYFVFISFWYNGNPSFMGAFFAFLMASVMNSIIYHKTGKFSGVIINSIIINSIFFGATSEVLIAILFGIPLL